MTEQKIKPYLYILHSFFNQHRISDQDIRQEFRIKFYKCYENYRVMSGTPIEVYLRKGLRTIKKRYWYDAYKKHINIKLYSELNKGEQREWEIALAIDKMTRSFEPDNITQEQDSPEILFIKSFIPLLTWRQQELIHHLFYEGLTFKEIGVKMGSTRQNVSKIWDRIKDKFNNHIVVDFGTTDSHKLLNVKEM